MSKILAINPGATSTKVAIFDGNEQIFLKNIKHSTEELSQFATIADQYEFRKNIITSTLEAEGINLHDINIVMGRGGLVKPLKSAFTESMN
jgi:butyrate kinase